MCSHPLSGFVWTHKDMRKRKCGMVGGNFEWLQQRPWQWFAVGGHPQTKHDQMTAMTSRKTIALL